MAGINQLWGRSYLIDFLLWNYEYFELLDIPLLHLSMDYMAQHGMLEEVIALLPYIR